MGSDASAKPAGWYTEATDIARDDYRLPVGTVFNSGHLLARQLGGSGSDLRNLVALYRNANQGAMKGYEDYGAGILQDDPGVTIFYAATPEYDGKSDVIPLRRSVGGV
jgi:DNA/RNA non-specific endonuclease